jgi:MFS family permease
LPGPLTSADADTRPSRLLVPALGLCLLVGTAAYLMVFTMLGQIASSLRASATVEGWIVIASIITGTVCAALFPALGSVIGQRWLMVASMACLALGSLISATAPDAAVLLIGRIIAAPGFSAGTLSIAVVRERVPQARLPGSFGVLAAFEGGAAGVGFTVGGAIERIAPDWHLVFLAIAVVAAVSGALAVIAIPAGAVESRRADIPGALLLASGLVLALLPITEGATWGWTSWRVAALLAAALALLTAWLVNELHRADPLVRLSAIALPGVAGGVLLFLVTGATVSVINLTVPAALEAPLAVGFGPQLSVLGTGVDLLPFALAITAAGLAAGRLAQLLPPREIAVVTLGCEALALVLLATTHEQGGRITFLLAFLLAVFGLGHGGTLAVEYVLLTRSVPAATAGGVTGMASAIDGMSGAVASAVTTAILASRLARVGTLTLHAATGYDRAWFFAAAVAAVGAAATAVGALADRRRTRRRRSARRVTA